VVTFGVKIGEIGALASLFTISTSWKWLSQSSTPPTGKAVTRPAATAGASRAGAVGWAKSPNDLLRDAVVPRERREPIVRAGAARRPEGRALAAAAAARHRHVAVQRRPRDPRAALPI